MEGYRRRVSYGPTALMRRRRVTNLELVLKLGPGGNTEATTLHKRKCVFVVEICFAHDVGRAVLSARTLATLSARLSRRARTRQLVTC